MSLPPRKKFQRYDPNQVLIIAPDLREWLPKDHLCYFVADVVAGLDLSAMYAEYDELRGAPPYVVCLEFQNNSKQTPSRGPPETACPWRYGVMARSRAGNDALRMAIGPVRRAASTNNRTLMG